MGDFRFEIWPTEDRAITQHFGVNPIYYAQFGLPGHEGIDIKAAVGGKIFCVAPGEVYRVHENAGGHNYGVHVRVAHQDGFSTIYGHLQKALVNQGQIVEAGTVLGTADSTGNSFGTHLHLSLKKKNSDAGDEADQHPNIWARPKKTVQIVSSWPYDIIDPTPFLLPLLGWNDPAGPHIDGWVLADSIVDYGDLAQISVGGATLYKEADKTYFMPAGTLVIVESKRVPYVKIRVPKAAIGIQDSAAIIPAPEPPPLISTVDGWAWSRHLVIVGNQAVVGLHGVSVRAAPENSASNIGMVKASSTVGILGPADGHFRPVRARRNDFIEPVSPADLPPLLLDGPPEDGFIGWVLSQYLSPLNGDLVLTSKFGVNLRNRPDDEGTNMGLVKAFATIRVTGNNDGDYTPVSIRSDDVINTIDPLPEVMMPEPLTRAESAEVEPVADDSSLPGWAFTNGLVVLGGTARVSLYGSNLRDEPRRDASKIGYIQPESNVLITGPAQGEYTPVRIREAVLLPAVLEEEDRDLDSVILGNARIGLHALVALDIPEEEHQEFLKMRPGIIKVLSTHNSEHVARLAEMHDDAHWIIRAALPFEGKLISPAQFLSETLSDVSRVLDQLADRPVVVELHSKPNIANEGLGSSWSDGIAFGKWWLELVEEYRQALPHVRYIFPGLSTGSGVTGLKVDHIRFLEASREAVEAADGIGCHLFWSEVFSMDQALDIVDDYGSRFRDKSIWISEAGRTGEAIPTEEMAGEYLRFWRRLQSRSNVQGVTFYVASASDPDLSSQAWAGKGIAEIIGRR
jgi:hypothetical protein